MLNAGRVDLVVESDAVFWPTVERLYGGDRSAFEALDYVVSQNRLFFIVPRNHP